MMRPRGPDGRKNIIGGRLRALRKVRRLTQQEVAVALQLMGVDVDRRTIARMEAGRRYVTDIELTAIATAFRVSCDALLDGKA